MGRKDNMTTVDNACDYIILRVCEAEECTSMLKLQKLLYYCQAWNLAIYKTRLFEDNFQAWIHGPVNRTIYNRFRYTKNLYSQVDDSDIRPEFNIRSISDSDKSFIDSVLEVYAEFTGTQLEQLTHSEEPWLKARQLYNPAQRCEEVIDDNVMMSCYAARLK